LLAVILFGSIARHEERPPDDVYPSNVDLLTIFDTTNRLVKPYREDIFATIIDACALHLDTPREVNVLLYARGSLPAPLAARQSLQGVLEDKGVTL
jgi:hypothetical protein